MAPPKMEDLAHESEENLRAKVRLLRTAQAKLAQAAERDGVYGDEMIGLSMALEEAVAAMEKALAMKRGSL